MEAFNGRVRDEPLNVEEFSTLFEAQVVVALMAHPVQHLPHSSLGKRTPAEYAKLWFSDQPTF